MKPITYPQLASFLIAMVCFVHQGHCQSDGRSNAVLPGHYQKLESVAEKSTDIVLASFLSEGLPSADSSGESLYEQAWIHVIEPLKGTLSGYLQVAYKVKMMRGGYKETTPKIGTNYILFIQKMGRKDILVHKILEANESNLAQARKLAPSAAQ